MAESGGGLKKLADYLAQTRRQAEASIDVLNKRIEELTSELEVSHAAAEHLQSERDYFRNHAEQLKLENSKKWRLQERDDWKSLVDSVQQDRSRLQDECHRLETALEEKEREIEGLKKDQQQQQRQRAPLSPVSSTSRFFFGSPVATASPSDGEAANGAASESPRAMNKQLKLELAKAHASLQVARASAESEISSLKMELERARKAQSKHPSGTVWARGGAQGRFSGGGSQTEEAGWYDPLGIFHFFFLGSKRDRMLRDAVQRV